MKDIKDVHSNAVPYLDHGFVALVDVMGSDKRIVDAARGSYVGVKQKETTPEEDRNLIRYLYRNRHTSPFEMVEFTFIMKMPIFVMRQHVRHRTASINELSGRYSKLPNDMYMPSWDRFQRQSTQNKQMSGGQLDSESIEDIKALINGSFLFSYEGYERCLDLGLARETARIQLPLSTYTEIYWKIDLKNLFHYIKLRADTDHAQNEIVQLATIIGDLIRPIVPFAYEAFEDYEQNALTFSRVELLHLKELLNYAYLVDEPIVEDVERIIRKRNPNIDSDLSKREVFEFITKIVSILKSSA